MDATVIATLQSVRTTLTYLVRTDQKPYSYTFEPPPGVPPRYGQVDAVAGVAVRDARPLADQLSLDEQGFVLRPHPTAVADFYDEEQLKAVYYPEVEALLKKGYKPHDYYMADEELRAIVDEAGRA